jgi:hypothetical protein
MHVGHVNEDHAHALHIAVLFSSRCGMRAHFESARLSVCEADNLEVLSGYGSTVSHRRLV